MWVYSCFEGDDDMALAWVQRDLYFCSRPELAIHIDGMSTLGWIWATAVRCSAARRHPWLSHHAGHMERLDRRGFSHKLLQLPHAHIAAYFRWTMPWIQREAVILPEQGPYPFDLLEAWKAFLRKDIPQLFASNDVLVPFAKCMVYQLFEEGDVAYRAFQDALMRRYGHACVAKAGWADEIRDRVLAHSGATALNTDEGVANG